LDISDYITTYLIFGLSHNTYLSETSFDDDGTPLCCNIFTHDVFCSWRHSGKGLLLPYLVFTI